MDNENATANEPLTGLADDPSTAAHFASASNSQHSLSNNTTKASKKRSRNDRNDESISDGENDFDDLHDLLSKWPSLGQGRHSDTSIKHHEWIELILGGVIKLHKRIAVLEAEKESKNKFIDQLEKKISDLENSARGTIRIRSSNNIGTESEAVDTLESLPIHQLHRTIESLGRKVDEIVVEREREKIDSISFASIAKKNTEAEIVLLGKVHAEFEQRNKLDSNIVICGLAEQRDDGAEDGMKDDGLVTKLLRTLGVDSKKMKRKARLRKKGAIADPKRPSQLLIEFVDSESATAAISNAKKLANTPEFKNVYVRKDMTETERRFEAGLRTERNKRNAALPHESNGLKYGLDESTQRRYYWCIRNMKLVKMEHRDDRARTN